MKLFQLALSEFMNLINDFVRSAAKGLSKWQLLAALGFNLCVSYCALPLWSLSSLLSPIYRLTLKAIPGLTMYKAAASITISWIRPEG